MHLPKKDILFIKKTFKNIAPQLEVYLFGSRATGVNLKKFSDIDLAIKSKRKFNPSIISRLKDAFDESDIEYRVDIVDLKSISKEFKDNILPDLVKLI